MRETLFNDVAGLSPAILLIKCLWHRSFLVNFAKFLRTPFLENTSGDCFYYLTFGYGLRVKRKEKCLSFGKCNNIILRNKILGNDGLFKVAST